MRTYEQLEAEIKRQLAPSLPSGAQTFYDMAMACKAEMSRASRAGNHKAFTSAMAAFGGVTKRWRRWLIEELTEIALQGKDTSRQRVADWQKHTFGQSVSATRLNVYAHEERSGGGRAAPLDIHPNVSFEAGNFYMHHKDDIKRINK